METDVGAPIRAAILSITAIGAVAAAAVAIASDATVSSGAAVAAQVAVVLALGALVEVGVIRPMSTALAAARAAGRRAEERGNELRRLHEIDEHLDAALDLAESEPEILTVVGRAVARLLPDRQNALLPSPPDQARVTWSIEARSDALGEPIPLGTSARCSALGRGRTAWFASSDELDACPHLRVNDDEVSSVCIPLVVGRGNVGVIHSIGAPGYAPDEATQRLVESLARRAGRRVDVLRSLRVQERPVAPDPLTGLPNHTVIHRTMRTLMAEERSFAIALCDLDRFAPYNDSEGHDRGDRALRLFAEVLCATLRPGDVIARYGGDKFLCVFPDCSSDNAAAAMERVRERLILELTTHELALFTASVGIGQSTDSTSIEALMEGADIALLVAKNEGGNRVRTSQFDQVEPT